MRWIEYVVFLALIVGLARPVGLYLARVFEGGRTPLDPLLRPIEAALHRLLGIDRGQEMSAGLYTFSFVLFGVLSALGLFALLMFQRALPGAAGRCRAAPRTAI
jgi:K+-transporting ATPase ATPase A chain